MPSVLLTRKVIISKIVVVMRSMMENQGVVCHQRVGIGRAGSDSFTCDCEE
jgi:hypothetical protein